MILKLSAAAHVPVHYHTGAESLLLQLTRSQLLASETLIVV